MITFQVIKKGKSYIVNVKAGANTLKVCSLVEARTIWDDVSRHLPCGAIYDSNYHDMSAHLSLPSCKEMDEIYAFRDKYQRMHS